MQDQSNRDLGINPDESKTPKEAILSNRLRIGIVSPEFPPNIGGMQSLSLGLADQMAQQHEVIVFTVASELPRCSFAVAATLSGSAFDDIAVLNAAEVDIWLTMNASYVAVAPKLTAPVVAYVHGNDFLNPWRVFLPRAFSFLWTKRVFRRLYWPHLASMWGRAMIAKGSPHCARILANSTNTRDIFLRTYKVDPKRVAICPPGVSDMFFQDHEGGTGENLHLVSTCRLSKNSRKNIDGVLRAVAEVKGDIRIRYTIVGYGEDRARLESLRDILGLSSIVEFRGKVSNDELVYLYRTADLFVLPVRATRRDIEGFGMVYIEANAAGTPVLASATGGAIDAIIDGRTGILLSGSEPADIAQGLRKFAASRQEFDPAAITAFASTFRWPLIATQVVSHLYDCLGIKVPVVRNE